MILSRLIVQKELPHNSGGEGFTQRMTCFFFPAALLATELVRDDLAGGCVHSTSPGLR